MKEDYSALVCSVAHVIVKQTNKKCIILDQLIRIVKNTAVGFSHATMSM